MFPGYASRLYNEMEDLYKEKTLKIDLYKKKTLKIDLYKEKILKIKSSKSDNGEKTSKSKSTKSDYGEKTSKSKYTKSDYGEKTSKKNKVINIIRIIDSARRKYSVFIGATVLAQFENSEEGDSGYWITKQYWEEVGPDIVLKKCQNIMA